MSNIFASKKLKKFSQCLCFLIKSTILHISLSFFYMSCIIVILHLPVHCMTNNASIRLYQPKLKMHDVHVLRCTGRFFSHTVRYLKRVVPIAKIRRKFSASKLNSPVRLSTSYRNTAF